MKKAVPLRLPGGVARSFLLSYLLILLIPMAAFLLANNGTINTITQNAADYHLSMLEQARTSLEIQLDDAQRMAMQIAQDSIVNDYLYSLEKGNATPYQIWQVQNQLVEYLATNQYASQLYLCTLKDHNIVSSSLYHKDCADSSHMKINGSSNLILSPLFEFSLGTAGPAAVTDDKISSDQTILFTRTFPDGVVDAAYGNIAIVFDQAQLEQLLSFSNNWTAASTWCWTKTTRSWRQPGKTRSGSGT